MGAAIGLCLISMCGCPGHTYRAAYSPLAGVDRYLKDLPLGNIAFNAPDAMRIDTQNNIHALVSASSSMDEIRAELEQRIGKDRYLQTYAIKLGPLMEAHLTGENFTIQAVTPEKQAVASNTTTHWQWEVTPRRGGHQLLHLAMNVIIYVHNSPEPRTVQTFDKTIEVEVSNVRRITDWARENWFWVFPAIGAVLAIVRWTRKKSKDKE